MDKSPRLVGQDWQQWVTQLLTCHYKKGDYQEVPDRYRGDAGIEGFSLDGCAYQAYGPEVEPGTPQWHNNLRDKITEDINKFIANKHNKLHKLFGPLQIKRWILLVPSFDDRAIIEHATKKTAEVIAANLPYVDNTDFRVVVINEEAFAKEKADLLRYPAAGIDIIADPVCDTEIDDWSKHHDNTERISKLSSKTERLPNLTTRALQREFEREVIKWWLEGQNVLDELRDYPETYETIRRAKSEQERYLRGHCLVACQQPYELLFGALAELESTVERRAGALSDGSRRAIAHEAVADWLMRCPLIFPEI